jgi:hypothetical protein
LYKYRFSILECAPQKVIDGLFRAGFFVVAISDRMLDEGKNGNPFVAILKPMMTTFTNNTRKYISYTLRHSFVETTENFFYYFPTKFINHALQY